MKQFDRGARPCQASPERETQSWKPFNSFHLPVLYLVFRHGPTPTIVCLGRDCSRHVATRYRRSRNVLGPGGQGLRYPRNKTLFAITGHVSLRIDTAAATSQPDINTARRKAWCAIRRDHPSIASQATYDFATGRFTRTYHSVRSDFERDAWLDATFIEISDGQSGVECANSTPPGPRVPYHFRYHTVFR